mmetsp:Transcript_27378/g.70352  ORF Transcript_27378/g.70352 Transcript_27378/m.70352 type:complete len:298 (-) Transcript_27378:1350-2243(-)
MGRFQTRQEIRCTHHSWVAASPVGIAAATEPEVHSYPDIGRTEQRPATSPPGTKSFDQHAPSWRRNGATTPHRLSASPTQAWPSPGAGGVDVAPLHAPRPPPRVGTEMYGGPRRASADGRGEDQPLRRFLPAAPRGLDVPQQLQLRGRLREPGRHLQLLLLAQTHAASRRLWRRLAQPALGGRLAWRRAGLRLLASSLSPAPDAATRRRGSRVLRLLGAARSLAVALPVLTPLLCLPAPQGRRESRGVPPGALLDGGRKAREPVDHVEELSRGEQDLIRKASVVLQHGRHTAAGFGR